MIDSTETLLVRFEAYINNQRAISESIINEQRAQSKKLYELYRSKIISDSEFERREFDYSNSYADKSSAFYIQENTEYQKNYKQKLLYYRAQLLKYIPKDTVIKFLENEKKKPLSRLNDINREGVYEIPFAGMNDEVIEEELYAYIGLVKGRKR